jgi:hypothetical protein
VKPLWKVVWRFLKKLKIELPYDPDLLLLGIYQKGCVPGYNRAKHTPMIITTLFIIAKPWKQPGYPTTDK